MLAKSYLYPLLALVLLGGCSVGGDRSPWPSDLDQSQAPLQRRDFVDSFLQGRWCEAETQYTMSLETSLRGDDFCAAADTARLAARLKGYLELDTEELARKADEYALAGLTCEGPGEDTTERDRRYTDLIEQGEFRALARSLANEPDSLFASVYARKGAREALDRGEREAALALVETARRRDARQGWVAFLREDWRLRLELEDDALTRQGINERIRILGDQILPCQ